MRPETLLNDAEESTSVKFAILPAFFLCLAAVPASAIVTLGLSNQNYALAGIGANASGDGQSTVTWGSCAFDGTSTHCTLSGPYTGLGAGGTYTLVVSYPGNGPFPLNAVSISPGNNNITFQATNTSSFVLTLTPTSGPAISFYSFANFSFFFVPASAACTGVAPGSCAVGQVGLTSGATITGPVTGSFDPTPSITPSGALTPDGYGSFPSTAPASWLVMYGVNLATVQSRVWAGSDFAANVAPTNLAGTTVTVAGVPAYIDYVSPGQVNVQVPSGIPTGPQPIVVTTAGGTSIPYTINVNPVEPGLLAPASFMINGNQYVVALFSNTSTYVLPFPVSGVNSAKAKPGDRITFYGIGFGPVTPNITAGQIVLQVNTLQLPFSVTFGNVPVTVNYSGLVPSIVGLYQFDLVVPNVPASDTVPVAFTLNGASGPQKLVIPIQ